MQFLMAAVAENQGLGPPVAHKLEVRWDRSSLLPVLFHGLAEIPYVMYFHRTGTANLALVIEYPLPQYSVLLERFGIMFYIIPPFDLNVMITNGLFPFSDNNEIFPVALPICAKEGLTILVHEFSDTAFHLLRYSLAHTAIMEVCEVFHPCYHVGSDRIIIVQSEVF